VKNAIGIFKMDLQKDEEILLGSFQDKAFLGQSFEADIFIDDPKVSGIHALIEKSENGVQLIDLGSDFGTFKKNQRISESPIEEGEFFRLGKQILYHRLIKDESILKNIHLAKDIDPKNPKAPQSEEHSDVSAERILQVTLYWGEKMLEVQSFRKDTTITLGEQRESTFTVAFQSSLNLNAPFPIATFIRGSLKLKLPVEASGIAWIDGQVFSIDTLRHRDAKQDEFGEIEVLLLKDDKADVQFGNLGLEFRFIKPPKPIAFNWFSELDQTMVKITLLLLILLLFLFLYAQLTPRAPEPVTTLADIPQNLKRILFDSGVQVAKNKKKAAIGALAQGLEGGRESGEEGRSAGSASITESSPIAPGSKTPVSRISKNERTIGFNKEQGIWSGKKSKFDIDSVFATNTKAANINQKNIPTQGPGDYGNVVSKLVGTNIGKGIKGTGNGGGGTSVDIGALKGNSTGGGMGHGDTGLIPSKGIEVNSNSPGDGGTDIMVIGGLDSDIIAAIIRRYLPQIQNCYEQQLVIHPALKGKVTAAFTIGPDGSVKNPTVAESSLRNQPTEKCIIDKIQNWKFPKPRGGGTVGVKYPFLLMSNRAH
jgi:hypothetical protein